MSVTRESDGHCSTASARMVASGRLMYRKKRAVTPRLTEIRFGASGARLTSCDTGCRRADQHRRRCHLLWRWASRSLAEDGRILDQRVIRSEVSTRKLLHGATSGRAGVPVEPREKFSRRNAAAEAFPQRAEVSHHVIGCANQCEMATNADGGLTGEEHPFLIAVRRTPGTARGTNALSR